MGVNHSSCTIKVERDTFRLHTKGDLDDPLNQVGQHKFFLHSMCKLTSLMRKS
jgi:hypothetical protein